jgi:hypothetical protein
LARTIPAISPWGRDRYAVQDRLAVAPDHLGVNPTEGGHFGRAGTVGSHGQKIDVAPAGLVPTQRQGADQVQAGDQARGLGVGEFQQLPAHLADQAGQRHTE